MPYMQMDEDLAGEKIAIRNSAGGSFRKYGSTSSQNLRRQSSTASNTNVIKHEVRPGDTLQGLALRYSVTMEQIRRLNRLWASDSLFLREFLLIPVDGDSPMSVSTSTVSMDTGSTSSRTNSVATDADDDEEASINEFLGKIDSSIALTKSVVQKCQNNSEYLNDIADGRERRKPAVSRLRQANNSNANANNNVVVVSNSRQVRTSLQKMERQQEEMFEL